MAQWPIKLQQLMLQQLTSITVLPPYASIVPVKPATCILEKNLRSFKYSPRVGNYCELSPQGNYIHQGKGRNPIHSVAFYKKQYLF